MALGAFAALSLAVFCSTVRASQAPLSTLRDVPLPGPASRFDYASLDEARGRLYIAHLGAGTIVVFDTRGSRVVAEIPAVAAVHGVLAIPSLGRVYATATGTNEVVAIDEATNRIIARMPGGEYPDGMAFDPITERLFVSDEAGGTDTVIDVRANRVVQEIALGGEAGNTEYDSVSLRSIRPQPASWRGIACPAAATPTGSLSMLGVGWHSSRATATRRSWYSICRSGASSVPSPLGLTLMCSPWTQGCIGYTSPRRAAS